MQAEEHPLTLNATTSPLQCGFSARVVQVLSAMEVSFESVNILEVRGAGRCCGQNAPAQPTAEPGMVCCNGGAVLLPWVSPMHRACVQCRTSACAVA